MWVVLLPGLAGGLGLAACDYSPSYDGTRCGADGACPDGYTCVAEVGQDVCRPAGLVEEPDGEDGGDGQDGSDEVDDVDEVDGQDGADDADEADGADPLDTDCPDADGDGHRDQACGGADCDDGDPQVRPGALEVCDGRDNDCDGAIDGADVEPLPPPCSKQFGVCLGARHAPADCVSGQWAECPTETYLEHHAAYAYTELNTCDGLDNDCDGQTDEELSPPACPLQAGVCAGALQRCLGPSGWKTTCDQGEYGVDFEEAAEQRCDGLDNDCDELVDEDLSRACALAHLGQCALGAETCQAGLWSGCPEPQTELCDGPQADEDCDGYVNEVCGCAPLETRPCPLQQGVCAGSSESCNAEGTWPGCDYGGSYEVSEASCDSQDNDCDGAVDQLTRGCEVGHTGRCAVGQELCDAGLWAGCPAPAAELCDVEGQDDNCDGTVDEGCECFDGWQRSCDNQQGVCQGTVQACQAGAWVACAYAAQPGYEATEASCDSLDNYCSGQVDGMQRACSVAHTGRCAQGDEACSQGTWSGCPGPEDEDDRDRCTDDVDNDCDGETDRDDGDCNCASAGTRGAPYLGLLLLGLALVRRRRRGRP